MNSCKRAIRLLKVAKLYLRHPEVQAIPFALSPEVVAKRIDKLLEEVDDEK